MKAQYRQRVPGAANRFLQLRDVSPVRHTLSVQWNTAHERTKRIHLRKAQQCISAMLDVLSP